METIKELFSKMDMSDKERMALEATLRGVDLEDLFNTMDNISEIIRPLYRKNMIALGVDLGSPEGDKSVDTSGVICRDCGKYVHTLVDGICGECRRLELSGKSNHTIIMDEIHEYRNKEIIGNEAWENDPEKPLRCSECGIILMPGESGMCINCKDDREEDRDHE